MRHLIFILLFTASAFSFAGGVGVSLEHDGEDIAGSRLAYLVKNSIAGSNLVHLAEPNDALTFYVYLVTTEKSQSQRGLGTIFSVTYAFAPAGQKPAYYFTSSVGQCTSDLVQDCAERITAETVSYVEMISKQNPSANKKRRK